MSSDAARASELPAPLTVAALYVETDGCYFGLPGVDPWDEKRDARLYPGPWPVVAHPPCRNWCILSNCRPEIIKGDDGGTFAAALFDVQTFGGILEHPRHSAAWAKYGLPYPSRYGWTQALGDPGYATEIDQGHYGHYVKKPTWLYYVGPEPPQLIWGSSSRPGYKETQTNPEIKGFNGGGKNGRSRPEHSRTPAAFRDLLIAAARSVYSERIVAA